MKTSFILLGLLLVFAGSCDPMGLGFKKNPAYVLDEAFKAVGNMDHEGFIDVSGKEALCLYGTQDGITYLRENLSLDRQNVKLAHTVLSAKHHKIPEYVGYWSYYSERYLIDIRDRRTDEFHLQAVVDCNYGTDEEKNEKYVFLKPKKYKKKECRLNKIVPKSFSSLPLGSRCNILRVVLDL